MQTFHELEQTQSVIATILRNSLQTNRINHAYIFTGDYEPLLLEAAQLFAKSLFCERRDQIEPCQDVPELPSDGQRKPGRLLSNRTGRRDHQKRTDSAVDA